MSSNTAQAESARGETPRAYSFGFTLPWLVFTGFFFTKFFYVTPPAWEIALSAVALAGFLAAFFIGIRSYYRPDGLLRPALVMLAIGAVMAPINPGANVFFSYPSWFLGRALSPKRAAVAIVGVAALVVGLTVVFGLELNFLLPAFLLAIGLGSMSVSVRRLEMAQEELGVSRSEAAHLARIAERERIARDLHDTVGHTLSLIALKSDLAAAMASDEAPNAAKEMREINTAARESLAEIRSTLSGYRELSLSAELDALAAALAEADVDASVAVDDVDLAPAVETALSMCFREAVTNVMRHAEAGHCTLARDSADIVGRVEDDGVGRRRPIKPGNGLTGMQQRIEQMGGRMTLRKDNGTQVEFRLPSKVASHGH